MKIFLCSTAYDLEDLRAMIVNRFGKQHEFIHFEDAAFPSRRGLHSHDQCIEAAKQADVVLCIIDKRYGGKYRGSRSAEFPDQEVTFKATIGGNERAVKAIIPARGLSISWCELITAYGLGRYVITFARQRTLDEKATRRKNQGVPDFKPAYVDDIRVFDLLDWITKQRKDNWIIPFSTAVDLEEKLAKWLLVAEGGVIPATPTAPRKNLRPLTVIVEGVIDAQIVHRLIEAIQPPRPVNVVHAGGKRELLNRLKEFARAYAESEKLIVLIDVDTKDTAEIDIQKNQFKERVTQLGVSNIHVVFAQPDIEEWLVAADPSGKSMQTPTVAWMKAHPGMGGVNKRLTVLVKHFTEARSRSQSLNEFIGLLQKEDATGVA